jgi:hypothetical protein
MAKSRNSTSCLSQFNVDELYKIHHNVYGGAAASKGNATLKTVVANLTHQLLWELKEPFTPPSTSVVVADATSRRPEYHIKTWKLLGKEVCRKAWLVGASCSGRMLRSVYSMVRCGISPVMAHWPTGADQERRRPKAPSKRSVSIRFLYKERYSTIPYAIYSYAVLCGYLCGP